MIELKDLHYVYPDGTQALRGVDLQIDAGERVALLGPNGAGKTTLALHLNGVLTPRSGQVRVAGTEVSSHTLRETLAWIEARLPQDNFMRISRSAVVNLDRIREIQPLFHGDHMVLLSDGTKLTLSRNFRERLEALLAQE